MRYLIEQGTDKNDLIFKITRCVLIEKHGGNRYCGGEVKLEGVGETVSHFDINF